MNTIEISLNQMSTLAHYNVIDDMINPVVTTIKDIPVYICGASIDDLTNFGGIVEEEPYNDEDFDDEDSDFENYDEYYTTSRKIGYIPAGISVEVSHNNDAVVLTRGNVSITLCSDYFPNPVFKAIPTSNGTIYFNYRNEHPLQAFDTIIENIREAGKIFGIEYDISYTTQKEQREARLAAARKKLNIGE